MSLSSRLYFGSVVHRRLRPHPHRLRYRVFWMLLDLDEIAALPRRLRLFAHNRFSALSFHDRDHGDGSGRPLRAQVEEHLTRAGIAAGGQILLLCMPRVFGYGFNPLSVYFCHGRDGALAAILYEVHNTFGERHSYLAPVAPEGGAAVEHNCSKRFYVSPFMDMDLSYAFRVQPPGEKVSIAIRTSDRAGPVLTAALAGEAAPLGDARLLAALLSYPLLTLKVIGAIHWHALRMWLKGHRLRPRPSAPDNSVTVVHNPG
ncbi:MAG: DUF1365 domain-containing protein [Pseudolabrys sp.]